MANFLADSLELQDLDGTDDTGHWGTISVGGLDAHPSVRGSDWEIPGKQGRDPGARVADSLAVHIHQWVGGSGSSHAAIRDSYQTRMTALKAIFDPERDYVTNAIMLTIHPTAEGVGGKVPDGDVATIFVRFLRFTGPPAIGDEAREFEIECESIDVPPVWVIEAGGS